MTRPFLGIALGGGGARGAAHIGVLQELDNAGIKADLIAGVSAGAIIGAMYAYSHDASWIEDQFRKVWTSKTFSNTSTKRFLNGRTPRSLAGKITKIFSDHLLAMISLHKRSIIDNQPIRDIITSLIPVSSFDELKIPLKIISTDLDTGADIVYEEGDLFDAIIKSCTIPGVIEPLGSNSENIVDGGIGMPVPIPALKDHCEFTLAIDIGLYKLQKLDSPNVLSMTKRAEVITSNRLKTKLASEADFVIQPDTMGMHWTDFEGSEQLFNNGRSAARDSVSNLEEKIQQKKTLLLRKNS